MSKEKAEKLLKKSKDLMESVDHHTYFMMLTIFRNPPSLTEITCEEYTTTTKTIQRFNEKQIREKDIEEYKTYKQKEYPYNIIAVRPFKTKEECQQVIQEEKHKFSLK